MIRLERTDDNFLIEMLNSPQIIYKDGKGGDGLSEYYINIKKACGNPEIFGFISDALFKNINEKTTCIAASGYGGVPFATTIAYISKMTEKPIKPALIRDNEENHGPGGFFDFHTPDENDKVSIVDDTLASSRSLKDMIMAVNSTGAEIIGCYVIAKRAIHEVEFIEMKELGLKIPLYYMFDTETVVRKIFS